MDAFCYPIMSIIIIIIIIIIINCIRVHTRWQCATMQDRTI
jgi:uncharacterized membrane protein